MWFLNSWVGLSDTSVEGELFLESKVNRQWCSQKRNWLGNAFVAFARFFKSFRVISKKTKTPLTFQMF